MSGDGEGIRQNLKTDTGKMMHHLEGRRAAIDDDRLAFAAESRGLLGDRALFALLDRAGGLERQARNLAEGRRLQSLRAAANALQLLAQSERGDIAPRRRFGRLGKPRQFLHGRHRASLNHADDDPVSVAFVHVWRFSHCRC